MLPSVHPQLVVFRVVLKQCEGQCLNQSDCLASAKPCKRRAEREQRIIMFVLERIIDLAMCKFLLKLLIQECVMYAPREPQSSSTKNTEGPCPRSVSYLADMSWEALRADPARAERYGPKNMLAI